LVSFSPLSQRIISIAYKATMLQTFCKRKMNEIEIQVTKEKEDEILPNNTNVITQQVTNVSLILLSFRSLLA
jgi:hypothetical protein